jgi:hypothetical protein
MGVEGDAKDSEVHGDYSLRKYGIISTSSQLLFFLFRERDLL